MKMTNDERLAALEWGERDRDLEGVLPDSAVAGDEEHVAELDRLPAAADRKARQSGRRRRRACRRHEARQIDALVERRAQPEDETAHARRSFR